MREISSVELQCAVRELAKLVEGGRIQRFYELGDGEFRLEVYAKERGTADVVAELKRRLGVARLIRQAPKTPTQFAMKIRKHVEGAGILRVDQYGMDRVAYFDLEKAGKRMRLLFEMFSNGNLILTGEGGKIIVAYRNEEWKDRKIRPGVVYVFPATGKVNPLDLSREKLRDVLDGKKLISCLASRVNAGGNYLEEVVHKSGLKMDRKANGLNDGEVSELMDAFFDVFSKMAKPEPVVYFKEGKPFDYAVVPLQKYAGLEAKQFGGIGEMLEFFYSTEAPKPSEEGGKLEKEMIKLRTALKGQRDAVGSMRERAVGAKAAGDKIYGRYSDVEALLESIMQKRKANVSWEEIEAGLGGKAKINRERGKIEVEL